MVPHRSWQCLTSSLRIHTVQLKLRCGLQHIQCCHQTGFITRLVMKSSPNCSPTTYGTSMQLIAGATLQESGFQGHQTSLLHRQHLRDGQEYIWLMQDSQKLASAIELARRYQSWTSWVQTSPPHHLAKEVRPATPSVASKASKASRASNASRASRGSGSCVSLGRRICSGESQSIELTIYCLEKVCFECKALGKHPKDLQQSICSHCFVLTCSL